MSSSSSSTQSQTCAHKHSPTIRSLSLSSASLCSVGGATFESFTTSHTTWTWVSVCRPSLSRANVPSARWNKGEALRKKEINHSRRRRRSLSSGRPTAIESRESREFKVFKPQHPTDREREGKSFQDYKHRDLRKCSDRCSVYLVPSTSLSRCSSRRSAKQAPRWSKAFEGNDDDNCGVSHDSITPVNKVRHCGRLCAAFVVDCLPK